ncbi:TetR/AcrR family transcriptional regulator [Sphingopyxis sp. PET50]|uniref:TetR/AcrR family transcriptional regulator n=1 Tax=Sphingopyxis sp. PET50 TaxID=2976533 RepID=UPI0021AE3B97|nr:TetR/AcrR family transcriptional regulator [Sphingopyxis sp. PET50]
MSKAETLDALMESAIHGFSKHGYEGASLRDIAAQAAVPLSTIHFYFGSKSELFLAVRRKAWAEIDQERSDLLDASLADSDRPPLEALVHALAYPIVHRALSHDERDRAMIYIVRSHMAHSEPGLVKPMIRTADRSMVRWIDAMMACCPGMRRPDMIWAFSFVVGAIYSWQLIDHRYDEMIGPDDDRSIEEVSQDIVAFCCSGIEAIGRRRLEPSY